MKRLLFIVTLVSVLSVGCDMRGRDGAPGPSGAEGKSGATGTEGASGATGARSFFRLVKPIATSQIPAP